MAIKEVWCTTRRTSVSRSIHLFLVLSFNRAWLSDEMGNFLSKADSPQLVMLADNLCEQTRQTPAGESKDVNQRKSLNELPFLILGPTLGSITSVDAII